MLKSSTIILTLLATTLCKAQTDSVNHISERQLILKLAYNSSLIYPGISAGIEFPILHISTQVMENGKIVRNYTKSRLLSGKINWYHHPEFHDNVYLTTEWIMRRTGYKGFISEFSMGPGFSRTFLSGTTYAVDDNGNVTVIKLSGYSYALITIGCGFGYDYWCRKQLPYEIYARMNLISMFPYNSTVYFRPVFEAGIRYIPGLVKSRNRK